MSVPFPSEAQWNEERASIDREIQRMAIMQLKSPVSIGLSGFRIEHLQAFGDGMDILRLGNLLFICSLMASLLAMSLKPYERSALDHGSSGIQFKIIPVPPVVSTNQNKN